MYIAIGYPNTFYYFMLKKQIVAYFNNILGLLGLMKNKKKTIAEADFILGYECRGIGSLVIKDKKKAKSIIWKYIPGL